VAVAVPVLRDKTETAAAGITVPAQARGEVRYVAVELLKLRQGPGSDSPIIEILDRFTTVRVVGSAEGGEWSQVVIPSGVTGYAQARYLFAGSGEVPKRQWCESNRGEPMRNGDVLLRRAGGSHRLTIANATGADAVVRLRTASGQTLLGLYVGAGEEAALAGIPEGSFRLTFATGSGYSRACGLFLENMNSFALDAPQIFVGGGKTVGTPVRLPPPGDETVLVQPFPADQFVD
jgi:hypothetical protein